MKKKSGWVAFFIGLDGRIVLQGNGMHPAIYSSKREAIRMTHGNTGGIYKTIPPQPVKIEWKE